MVYTDLTTLPLTSAADIANIVDADWTAVPASDLQALSPDASNQLGDQVGALPTNAMSSFTITQLQTFSLTQVPSLAHLSSVTQLDGSQNFALTAAQIHVLGSGQLSSISSTQYQTFSSAQIQSLVIDNLTSSIVGYLTADQVSYFTSAQLEAINGKGNSWVSALNADSIPKLSYEQVNKIYTNLSLTQMGKLTCNVNDPSHNQIANLTNITLVGYDGSHNHFNRLSASQIAAITPTQISGVIETDCTGTANSVNADAQLKNLTQTQLRALSSPQIKAFGPYALSTLTSDQYQMFTNDQVICFNPDQIAQMYSIGWGSGTFLKLSPDQMVVMTKEQVGKMTYSQISNLTDRQTAVFTADQVSLVLEYPTKAFDIANLRSDPFPLSATQVGYLTSGQVESLKGDQVYSMSSAQVSAIPKTLFSNLTDSAMKSFSDANISYLTYDQINNLSDATKLNCIYVSQFTLFDASVNSLIKNSSKFLGSESNIVTALTKERRNALDGTAKWNTTMTGSTDSIQLINNVRNYAAQDSTKTTQELTYLAKRLLTYLSPSQVTAIRNAVFNTSTYFSRDSLTELNKNLFANIANYSSGWSASYPPVWQINQLVSGNGSSLVYGQVNSLSAHFNSIPGDVLNGMPNFSSISASLLGGYSQDKFNLLTGQYANLSATQLNNADVQKLIESNIASVVAAISVVQINSVTDETFKGKLQTQKNKAPLTFNVDKYIHVAETSPTLSEIGIVVLDSDYTLHLQMKEADIKSLFKYKQVADGDATATRFYTTPSYFKVNDKTLDAIEWAGVQVDGSDKCIGCHFIMNIAKKLFPGEDGTRYMFTNTDAVVDAIDVDVNTKVKLSVHSVLDPLDQSSSGTGKVLDVAAGKYYTDLRGENGDMTAEDLPTALHTFIAAQQPSRLTGNSLVDGFFPMPIQAGDKIEFAVHVTYTGIPTIKYGYIIDIVA